MSRKLFFILLFVSVFAFGKADAQIVQFGVRGGISMQNMDYPQSALIGEYGELQSEGRIGFHVGLLSRIRLFGVGAGAMGMGLYLQPEIIYTQSRYGMAMTSMGLERGSVGSKIQMQTLDVPVMLSFKVSIVRIGLGPTFKVLEKTVSKNANVDISSIRPTVGYTFGASIDLGRHFLVDARYLGQFKKVSQSIAVGKDVTGSDLKGRLSGWSVSAGVVF